MAEHAINGLMGVTMDKIRELVDSNTIIGNPITMEGGVTILPVSKVTFGVATGGSDFSGKSNKDLFGGGTGAGVTVSPVAFLVVKGGNVRTIQLADPNNSLERAITMLPELVDKLGELLRKEKPAAEEFAVEQPPVEE
ncbi:MAG: GerW family sporulation protein [Oscillospiraceae bacterium]|nr:GerW family sporulation protein [Oscillospiraceae bacterium]